MNNFQKAMSIISMFLCMSSEATDFKIGKFESSINWKSWAMSKEEQIYQMIHVVDSLQTNTYRNEPCFHEIDKVSVKQLGRNPDAVSVLAWSVAHAAIGHYTFQFIENSNMPRWLKHTTKWIGISARYDTISNNHSIGIRIGKKAKYQPDRTGYCLNWK